MPICASDIVTASATKMSLLKSIENSELTEYVVKLLNNRRIFTVAEFLQENSAKLSSFTNIPVSTINTTKRILYRTHCPELLCAFKKYQSLLLSPVVVTKIDNLDLMLSNELPLGSLVEICGLPSTGKSIFCSTISLNFAQHFNYESIYIDTKRDFSGTRIKNFLAARRCAEKEVLDIMNRIRVVRVYNAPDLLSVLKNLLDSKEILSKIKLLIIDSLPSIWFQYHGLKLIEGATLMSEVAQLLKRFTNVHGILVIVVNLATSWAEFELEENISEKSQTTIKPSLGKYWETVPSHRLIIEELSPEWKRSSSIEAGDEIPGPSRTSTVGGTFCESQRFIKILKSNCYETGRSCEVLLTDKGMF